MYLVTSAPPTWLPGSRKYSRQSPQTSDWWDIRLGTQHSPSDYQGISVLYLGCRGRDSFLGCRGRECMDTGAEPRPSVLVPTRRGTRATRGREGLMTTLESRRFTLTHDNIWITDFTGDRNDNTVRRYLSDNYTTMMHNCQFFLFSFPDCCSKFIAI